MNPIARVQFKNNEKWPAHFCRFKSDSFWMGSITWPALVFTLGLTSRLKATRGTKVSPTGARILASKLATELKGKGIWLTWWPRKDSFLWSFKIKWPLFSSRRLGAGGALTMKRFRFRFETLNPSPPQLPQPGKVRSMSLGLEARMAAFFSALQNNNKKVLNGQFDFSPSPRLTWSQYQLGHQRRLQWYRPFVAQLIHFRRLLRDHCPSKQARTHQR